MGFSFSQTLENLSVNQKAIPAAILLASITGCSGTINGECKWGCDNEDDSHPSYPQPSHPDNGVSTYEIKMNVLNAKVTWYSRKTGQRITSFQTNGDCKGFVSAADVWQIDNDDEVIVEVTNGSLEKDGCRVQEYGDHISGKISYVLKDDDINHLVQSQSLDIHISNYEIIFNGILLGNGPRNVGTYNGTGWRDYTTDIHADNILQQREKAISEALSGKGDFAHLELGSLQEREHVLHEIEHDFNPYYVYEMIDENGNIWLQLSKGVRYDTAGQKELVEYSFDGNNWFRTETLSCVGEENQSGYCAVFGPGETPTVHIRDENGNINSWTIGSQRH